MSKKGTSDIVNGMDFSLGFPILRRGMRAREAERHPIKLAKFPKFSIVVLPPIITLDGFNITFKLGLNMGFES